MSPSDALSSSPPLGHSPPKPSNGNTVYTSIGNFSKVLPTSPSVSVSAFALPADKKDEATTGGRERGNFEQTRGNWGNRIVLTTYPGQANVGMTLSFPYTRITCVDKLDPFPLDWGNPDPHLRGPSTPNWIRVLTG